MDRQLSNNQCLFSEYYLQDRVRDDEFWQESLAQAHDIWEELRNLYHKVTPRLPGANEAKTERLFIRPVLDKLGHIYALQPTLPSPEGPCWPDFSFFATEDDLREAERIFKGKVEFFKTSLAVGDAKQWDRSLDKKLKGPGDPFTNHNPSYQIDYYIRTTSCRWGILTNGRLWRLYNRDTSYRFDVYYEIDLPSLLETEFKPETFIYFFAFFRKEAFIKIVNGECFLDRAYKASLEYNSKLGEELKENVYEALRLLAEGFLKFPGNALSTNGDLDCIRENTFVLISRILFTLYAEDRGLLPVHNPVYHSYSLRRLAREVAEKLDQRVPLSPTVSGYWARVTELFRIVNEGDSYLGVPPYNGGLFDDTKHSFLAKYRIGDSYLAQAIDRLTRAEASGRIGRGFLSYRDMEIRHLGSIYEGLLEHRLRVPQVDIAVIKEDKREKFVPASEAGKRRVLKTYKAGEVYLETDKGERKAKGSYYTPDYIVKYIVENTLGPLIQEKKQKIRKKLDNLKEKVKVHRGANREAYERELKRAESELIDEILSIKVLDPAMGSGHFLVEATDYLARALVEAFLGEAALETPMAEVRLKREEPLPYGAKTVVLDKVKTVASELASDEKARLEEEDIRWARREVVEKCIYGVDLNPLAVELAKLSLWLYTVAVNKPLNFLDHHLRCGNSLIGARIKDLVALPALRKKKVGAVVSDRPKPVQLGLFEQVFKEKVNLLLKDFELIEMLPSQTVEDIKRKDEYYQNFRKRVERFKEVADIWTSVYFGNEVAWQDYQTLQEKLRTTDQEWQELKQKPWFVKGLKIKEQKRFFHWELEFPEVFYKGAQEKENPGFDVVVGNPPWGAALNENEKGFFKERFICGKGIIDSFALFLEGGLNLVRKQGRHGMIYPDIILLKDYPMARKLVLDRSCIEFAVHWGQPFPDAQIDAATLILGECQSLQDREVQVVQVMTRASDNKNGRWESRQIPQRLFAKDPAFKFNLYLEPNRLQIIALLERSSKKFCTLYHSHEGIHSGNIRDKLFPMEKVDRDCCPLIFGRDEIDRYILQWNGRYVRYTQSIIHKELGEYANLGKHDYFKAGNILIRRTGDRLKATINSSGYYFSNNLFVAIPFPDTRVSPYFTIALLNSRLLTWYFRTIQPRVGRLFAELKIVHINQLPIRHIEFTTSLNERAQLLEKGKALYDQCLAKNDETYITIFVDHCLGQKPEQADVVHDLLAFLAEQMIALNKAKLELAKQFFVWLKDVHRIDKDAIKPKMYLEEFWTLGTSNFFGHLERNKIKPSPIGSTQIKGAFDEAASAIRTLVARLHVTDRLIDQIVYRLYGLPEAEIQIVEGSDRP